MRFAYGPVLDGINYLNWETPPGSKALVNVPLTYFINRTIYHTSAIDKMGSLGEALAYLEAKGIGYVFLADTDSGPDPHAGNPVERSINESSIFNKVYENSRARVYKINYGSRG